MKTRSTLGQLYNECIKDSKTIPSFLNLKISEHKLVLTVLTNCIIHLSELIVPTFKNDKQIHAHLIKWYEIMMGFDETASSLGLYMNCYSHLNDLLDKYISMALSIEEYESLSNLMKFVKFKNEE